MRIKRLELKNFRGFEQAAVDFPEDNAVVFFGENGAGKTSILSVIAKILSHLLTDGGLLKTFGSLDFEVEDIMAGKKKSSVELSFLLHKKDTRVVIGIDYDLAKENPIQGVYFGPSISGSKSQLVYEQIENSIKSDNPIPVLAYYKTNREIQLLKKADQQDSYGSFSGRMASYNKAFTASIDNFEDFEEWFRYQEDIENEEKITQKDLNYVNTIRNALNDFLKPLSDISGSLRVKQINYANSAFSPTKEFSLVTEKYGQELRLSQLSSGERALVLLVADIARRAAIANPQMTDPLQSAGVVLIDEIELHLHPKWQRTVIPALRKTFPNIQFIIATHSPQVLSNVENGSVFEIEDFQILPRNTYGRDNQWILEAVMDDESRPKEIQEKLDEYFSLIREGNLDAAAKLRTDLEAQIGTDEPEFTKADILIRRKERSVMP